MHLNDGILAHEAAVAKTNAAMDKLFENEEATAELSDEMEAICRQPSRFHQY